MQSYTLLELNEYIKRVIALNFEDSIWIECEISNISEVRGQVYLDLIQKAEDTDEILAQASAAIWYKSNLFIKNKLKDLYSSILSNGIQIKCKVSVSFHERWGFKLSLEDVDATYTLGNLELEKQKIIDRLTKEELIGKNKLTQLPSVIRSVAVISSQTAAGYKDFLTQLSQNPYGYKFRSELFQSAMQGANTESEVCAALRAIATSDKHFDCIAILRGGGSKIDLSYFDNYSIAKTIAESSIPVITGIGHEIDYSITDMVSHSQVKTPTALADFIIDTALHFESSCIERYQQIIRHGQHNLNTAKEQVNLTKQTLEYVSAKLLATKEKQLELVQTSIKQFSKSKIELLTKQLEGSQAVLNAIHPKTVLKRGYAIVKQKENIVIRKSQLKHTKDLSLEFSDGEVKL